MKLTRLRYSILCLMLFTSLATFAQQKRFHIQSVATFHPPHTVMVPLWYSGPTDRISVTLTNQDMRRAIAKVRLRMRLRGAGVYITSKDGVNYPIIDLPAGIPVRLSQSDLEPYLRPENWNFEGGLSYSSYVRSYTLPQGRYDLTFDVEEVDYQGIQIDGQAGSAFLSLNDPPFLNMPRKGENIVHRDPSNIIFQWTPRHMTDPYMSFNTEYEFSMMELIDKGMTPEVAFMQNGVQPFYQERSPTSMFLYGAAQPLLTPGRRYAWRIGVKANDGTTLSNFKNDGYSEVYWFTYQTDCLPPVTIQAEPMSVAARITWTPVFATTNGVGTGGNYVVEYRPYKMDGGEWWPTKTTSNKATLTNLKPDRTYEYRVGRSCDDNLSFVYSDIKRFKTNVEQTYGDCGEGDSEPPEITNREPIQTLHVGDVITAGGGGTRVRLTQVSGQGSFTGYGYSTMVLTRHAQFKVKFANIIVNTDKQLIGGFIQSTYDPLEKQVLELGGGQEAPLASSQPDPTSATLPFEISSSDDIQIADEETSADAPSSDTDSPTVTPETTTAATTKPVKLNIKNPDGTVKQVAVGKLPATIQDKNNTVYKVEKGKNGKTLVTKVGKQESARPSSMLAGATSNTTIKATVAFKNYPEKQRYAFDEYQATYVKSKPCNAKYEVLSGNYFVSSKAITEGQADVVKAVLISSDKNMVADSVRFVSHQGMRYPSKLIGDNTFEVSIMGGTAGQAQALYAVYPQGKSTVSLGKLLITSYAIVQRKVVLVPVNDAAVDKQAISEQLNAIYNPVGVQFDVSQDAYFNDISWDQNRDGKLAVKGSGLFSTLTSEMRALNQAYARSRNVEDSAIYLFILNSADEKVAGDMPRGKQFGYLFSGNDGKLAAHEIGHGLFRLQHIFDGLGFKQGELPNNLMDYPAGDQLTKHQWDQLRNPSAVISIFEREQDGEMITEKAKNIASIDQKITFCETDPQYYKGLYDGALEGGKDALRLLTLDGMTDFAKGLGTLVWHWNPFNWSNEAVTFRDKMVTEVGATLKKMVITDDCYQSGKIWGNTLIGIFGTEGLVAVGKGTVKLGKLANVSANRVAKIEKLSQEEALVKAGAKTTKIKHIDSFWARISGSSNEIKQAFINNTVTLRYAKQDIYLYRHCNKGAPQLSNWYTDNILSPIDARRELALPTANTAQRIVKVKIPQGTPYIEGRVASQTNNPSGLFGAHATGGGKQFYFLDEHKNVIEVIEDNVNLK